jgi:non-specific serine/threonine protein kinase
MAETHGTGTGATQSFGALLRHYRALAGLTQEERAERARLSARGISALESGERTAPRRDTVHLLAEALGLDEPRHAAFAAAARPRRAAGGAAGATVPASLPGASNLPLPLTSFVGRVSELARVRDLLETARLLTLTGAGGSGKTRLALEVAGQVRGHYPDGVWLVELAVLSDPALVPLAVARALGVRIEPRRAVPETLAAYLEPRTLLLLLDNCEHQVDPCAQLVAALLRAAPGLRILATSREPLNVAGETVWSVPPLALPQPAHAATYDAVIRADAARLFVERARSAHPDLVLTDADAQAVAEICRRLDGIPLALELAAARVRALPVGEIAARLDGYLALLTAGSRTAPPRHRTLRACIDWGYDLLSEPDRALWRRLAVFQGSFSLESAEAVCAGGGIERDEILDRLAGLVDQSLVLAEEGWERSARFRLLEPLRQYGREKLAADGDAPALARRYLDYHLALAERTELDLETGDQSAVLARLEQDHDNLRAALGWAEAAGARAEGLRLVGALGGFWETRGHYDEGRGWFRRLSAGAAAQAVSPAVRAKALRKVGLLAYRQGDGADARALFEESLALAREVGDTLGEARSLNNLGELARMERDYDAAHGLFEESLALARAAGDTRGEAWTLNNLAAMAWVQDDHVAARRLLEMSLALKRQLNDTRGMAHSLNNLAEIELRDQQAGSQDRARDYYAESLLLFTRLGDGPRVAESLAGIAMLVTREQPEQAGRLFGAAERLREEHRIAAGPLNEEYAYHLERVAEALGDAAATAAVVMGKALSTDQAVAEALAALKRPQPVLLS